VVCPTGLDPPREDGDVSEIVVTRTPASQAAFSILAQMDLGADAANLHRPGAPVPPWAGPLRIAYRAAPARLQLHAVGMHHDTLEALLAALDEGPPGLRDDAGRRLASAFADALRRFTDREALARDADAHAHRRRAFEAQALPDLATLRAALWETRTEPPPPLTILDCPALGEAGRATTHAGRHVVAVGLGAGPEHALIQVLHEQIHPVTDPLVEADGPRDTQVGAPGFARHAQLERLALDVGAALVEARAPHRRDAYARWMARFD
jgi:hypothetical protein